MSFDIEKRDKILQILDRFWLTNLKSQSNRTMVADLITKELFGDKEGYLNNTAYGDKPYVQTSNPNYSAEQRLRNNQQTVENNVNQSKSTTLTEKPKQIRKPKTSTDQDVKSLEKKFPPKSINKKSKKSNLKKTKSSVNKFIKENTDVNRPQG